MDKFAFDVQDFASGAAQKALAEVGNLKQITEQPFEILFKYIWPGLMFLKGRWILALLMGAAQSVLGIGPETIGAWIDKAIGKGPGSGNSQVSEGGLENAAKGLIESITGGLFSKSSTFRTEILKRGEIDAQSLIVAWANGPDKIEKEAASIGSKLRQMFAVNPNRSKGLLSGMLFSLLKALLVGVGLQSGVNILLGSGSKLITPTAPSGVTPTTTGSGMRLYTNPANDVEKSLLIALDNTIKDKEGKPFSKLFIDLKGYSPIGSPEMDRILGEVRSAHGGASIQEISNSKTFAAPSIAEIAQMLLPQATYKKNVPQEVEVENRIGNILGGSR